MLDATEGHLRIWTQGVDLGGTLDHRKRVRAVSEEGTQHGPVREAGFRAGGEGECAVVFRDRILEAELEGREDRPPDLVRLGELVVELEGPLDGRDRRR